MKIFPLLFAAVALAGLAGCRSLGYNDQSFNNSMTPEVSETQQVRTYDQAGNPTVTTTPSPARTDPSSPDYQGPAPAK